MRGITNTLIYIFLWLALSVLGGLTAWYLHIAILALFALIIESPAWRPYGWSTGTLSAVSRMSVLLLGGAFLIYCTWLERALRMAQQEKSLWQLVGRVMLVFGLLGSGSFLLLSL